MSKSKDDVTWKKLFGFFLRETLSCCDLDYRDYANKYKYSESTIRHWFSGDSLPQPQAFKTLRKFLKESIDNADSPSSKIFSIARDLFKSQEKDYIYFDLRKSYPETASFICETLISLYNLSKSNYYYREKEKSNDILPTGKTQVVVFDFDGTLTSTKSTQTTWETIWVNLGYDITVCQSLHQRYDRKELSHEEWCNITEEKFKERNLDKSTVEKIAKQIHLLPGVRQTFQELKQKDIKIYIISGSIHHIIRVALGSLTQFIDSIKANEFRFDEQGLLTQIIGTDYDFEGKASFISKIASELRISPKDILFVGNSVNDRFAFTSGARTLCINPKLTDPSNVEIWNDCIQTCNNLKEILKFL